MSTCTMCMRGILLSRMRTCLLCRETHCPHCFCNHTVEEIKEKLPRVLVKHTGAKEYPRYAVLSGRKLECARVYPLLSEYEECSGEAYDFSWEAVQRSVNRQTPLLI